MKKTALVLAFSLLQVSNSFAGTFNYACKVTTAPGKYIGRSHLLHVDEGKKVIEFEGKTFRIIRYTGNDDTFIDGPDDSQGCAKYCWTVKGSDGVSFTIGTATKGVAYFMKGDLDWDCEQGKLPQRP